MFRFTIRDVLWLTVVVGVSVCWFNEHRSATAMRAAYIELQMAVKKDIDGFMKVIASYRREAEQGSKLSSTDNRP